MSAFLQQLIAGLATGGIYASVALAREMKLSMTEVYEVVSFYHHFDIVKEGDTPPPALTVRVPAIAARPCPACGCRPSAR